MDVKTKVAKATLAQGCLSLTGPAGFSKEDLSPFILSFFF